MPFGSASGILQVTPARLDTCRASGEPSCGSIPRANVSDIEAHGGGFVVDPLYSVRFASRELWGEAGTAGDFVHVDLFERYLQEA